MTIMESKVFNYLAMIGIAAVGIGKMIYNVDGDYYKIQRDVFLDMNDVMEVERRIQERKRNQEKELQYKGYTFFIKE